MGNYGKFLNSKRQIIYNGIFEPSVTRRSPQKQKFPQIEMKSPSKLKQTSTLQPIRLCQT